MGYLVGVGSAGKKNPARQPGIISKWGGIATRLILAPDVSIVQMGLLRKPGAVVSRCAINYVISGQRFTRSDSINQIVHQGASVAQETR